MVLIDAERNAGNSLFRFRRRGVQQFFPVKARVFRLEELEPRLGEAVVNDPVTDCGSR